MAFEICCIFLVIAFLAIIVLVEIKCYRQGYFDALKYYHCNHIIKLYNKEESKGSYESGWNEGMNYVKALFKV